jgi:type IV secretion system protein VirD4
MSHSSSRSAPPPVASDRAVLALLGAVGGLLGLTWLWGGLAGSLLGTGWPRTSPLALAEILLRLPGRLSQPAAAWPAADRRLLPGTIGLYLVLAGLVMVCVALTVICLRGGLGAAMAGGQAGWAGAGRGGAGWARAGELRPLRGRRRQGRLALGRRRGRLLHAEQRHALVAFGPPQSGKSAGLAVPALLEWEGPAVASSIKTDLLATTVACRRQLGRVFVYDPFELAGRPGDGWSPLAGAATWDGALEVAGRLAAAGEIDQRGTDSGDFWAIAAEQRLAPLLFTAARSERDMGAVVRWAYGQGARELDEALAQVTGTAEDEAALQDAHAAYDAVRAFETQADRTRSSIEATVQALLRAYRFTRVLRSAQRPVISADRLLDERATLYLVGDAKASRLLRPILLALLSEVVDRAYERATRHGGRLELPLLLCLDELGNVAPLPNLAEIASTAPSHNIQLISIFHDMAQARSRYGRQAETVVNSHRARLLLPGVADLDTLRYFAELVGDAEVRETSRTSGAGGASRTVAVNRRPLLAAEALRRLPADHALLLYGRLAPVTVALRLWFRDRRLRRLAAGGGGGREHRRRAAAPPRQPMTTTRRSDGLV